MTQWEITDSYNVCSKIPKSSASTLYKTYLFVFIDRVIKGKPSILFLVQFTTLFKKDIIYNVVILKCLQCTNSLRISGYNITPTRMLIQHRNPFFQEEDHSAIPQTTFFLPKFPEEKQTFAITKQRQFVQMFGECTQARLCVYIGASHWLKVTAKLS